MAATGDEAAAMDSISRVPVSHPTGLSLAGASGSHGEGAEPAAESLLSVPKKTSTNSESCFVVASVARWLMLTVPQQFQHNRDIPKKLQYAETSTEIVLLYAPDGYNYDSPLVMWPNER